MMRSDIALLLEDIVSEISKEDVNNIVARHDISVELGFDIFEECDKRIPGKGVHNIEKPNGRGGFTGDYELGDRPIYRPFQYVEAYFSWDNFEWLTRDIVRMACLHVESCLKRYCKRYGTEMFGNLLNSEAGKTLPRKLWTWLDLIRVEFYNTSKHHITKSEDHLFSKEDAISVYFICRKLGYELLSLAK
jgi:hypothetical protein